MIRSRAALLLPIITAFAEGKEIEYRRLGSTPGQSTWEETNNPSWVEALEYRIKPEVPCYRLWKYGDHSSIGLVLTTGKYDKKHYERVYNSLSGRWITDWIPCPAINED